MSQPRNINPSIDEVIQKRLGELPVFESKVQSGSLKRYSQNVTNAETGAVFRDVLE